MRRSGSKMLGVSYVMTGVWVGCLQYQGSSGTFNLEKGSRGIQQKVSTPPEQLWPKVVLAKCTGVQCKPDPEQSVQLLILRVFQLVTRYPAPGTRHPARLASVAAQYELTDHAAGPGGKNCMDSMESDSFELHLAFICSLIS